MTKKGPVVIDIHLNLIRMSDLLFNIFPFLLPAVKSVGQLKKGWSSAACYRASEVKCSFVGHHQIGKCC